MIRFRGRLGRPHSIGVVLVPLIDVVFILLIFFLMGSNVVLESGITLDLPESDEPKAVADKLIISLTRERLMFFNDQKMSDLNDLENRLIAAVGKRSRAPIIILRADKEVMLQDLAELLSVTRRHGMRVFVVTKDSTG